MSQKVLLNATEINIALNRLACQLIEKHDDFSKTVLIGIQPRGVFLAERLKTLLETEYKIKNIKLGYLDITFYRDDFRRGEKPLEANKTKINGIRINHWTGREDRCADCLSWSLWLVHPLFE